MRRFALLCVALLLAAPLSGPVAATDAGPLRDGCTFPVTMTDATGTEVTVAERPERVTTTNPSAAQTMWEIGGRSQVVGLSQYAGYLAGADNRTDVSASFGVNVETVVGTDPDLVIAPNASAGDVAGLRRAGLTVYHLPAATSVEDIREKTTTIGRLTGNCEGAAETNAWMDANVAAVEAVTANVTDRPTVLYPLGGGYVAAGDTFIDALFALVGADNVAARNHTGYPQLSDEVVRALDPEILVVTEQTAGIVTEEPYASTTAGETNSTVTVPVQDLNQPAPRSVVSFAHNATAQLYPERYDPDSYVPRSAVEASPTEPETDTPTTSPTAVTGSNTETPMPTTATNGPGFTAVATLLAVLATLAVARRRA